MAEKALAIANICPHVQYHEESGHGWPVEVSTHRVYSIAIISNRRVYSIAIISTHIVYSIAIYYLIGRVYFKVHSLLSL